MTAINRALVTCDHIDTAKPPRERICPENVEAATVAQARAEAQALGWTRVPSLVSKRFDHDRCPAHRPEEGDHVDC